MDALADGMDSGGRGQFHEVCTTGRCGRMINSLTLLDQDPEVARPMKTREILRNEVFMKSHQIIQARLAQTPQEIAAVYQGSAPETEENRVAVRGLVENLKKEIDETIREDHSNVEPRILDDLIRDAQAGVEF
jgi:hypothetical protein